MNQGREIWASTTKARRLRRVKLGYAVSHHVSNLASLLTQRKEQDVNSNTKNLELIHKESGFHGTLADTPFIASMHTLASLSTTMSWKFSDLAISMAQVMVEASAMPGVKKGRPLGPAIEDGSRRISSNNSKKCCIGWGGCINIEVHNIRGGS